MSRFKTIVIRFNEYDDNGEFNCMLETTIVARTVRIAKAQGMEFINRVRNEMALGVVTFNSITSIR